MKPDQDPRPPCAARRTPCRAKALAPPKNPDAPRKYGCLVWFWRAQTAAAIRHSRRANWLATTKFIIANLHDWR